MIHEPHYPWNPDAVCQKRSRVTTYMASSRSSVTHGLNIAQIHIDTVLQKMTQSTGDFPEDRLSRASSTISLSKDLSLRSGFGILAPHQCLHGHQLLWPHRVPTTSAGHAAAAAGRGRVRRDPTRKPCVQSRRQWEFLRPSWSRRRGQRTWNWIEVDRGHGCAHCLMGIVQLHFMTMC